MDDWLSLDRELCWPVLHCSPRKMIILKHQLTYPSGTATAYLINSFHTPKGAKLAKEQVVTLFCAFCGSFGNALFRWFFARADGCGFNFPLGMQTFYLDFSGVNIGVGMVSPYMVSISSLIGAIISWGIMWPYIATKEGNWYTVGLLPSSLHGIQGYRVFIAIAMILGDGLFHFIDMLIATASAQKSPKKESESIVEYDERKRMIYFLKDQIPDRVAVSGYILLAAISIGVVPAIFPQLKWYHILVIYVMAPVLAFSNAYGCGLTNLSLASNYGKIAIIRFSSWVGLEHGGIVAGLASCGIMMSIVSTASDLMQNFKTGYLTLTSPRLVFVGQILGTAMGCVLSPLVFWFFYEAYSVGHPESSYPAPDALLFRGIALLGVEGISSLPKHCLALSIVFFVGAIVVNVITALLKKFETKWKIYRFIPDPMSMAIPFYLGGYIAIDMCMGSLILFAWERLDKRNAEDFVPAFASGLICGESLWKVPASIMSLAGLKAPMCAKFSLGRGDGKEDRFPFVRFPGAHNFN